MMRIVFWEKGDGIAWFESFVLEDEPLPFELGMFKVEDNAYFESGDFEVVHHLTDLVISDPINGFGVHHDLLMRDEIGDVFANPYFLVDYWKAGLLRKWDFLEVEFHGQSIFIRFLMQPVAKFVKHFNSGTNHGENLVLQNQFVSIRVHSWLN